MALARRRHRRALARALSAVLEQASTRLKHGQVRRSTQQIARRGDAAENLHRLQARIVQFAAEAGDAVGQHHEAEVAMEGIARGALDANIGTDAGEASRVDAETAQPGLEAGVMEPA